MQNNEKRVNEKLLAYWQEIRGDRAYPLESDIEPEALHSIWNMCFLISVNPDITSPKKYKYTYLGEELIKAYDNDLSDKETCETLVYPIPLTLLHTFDEMRISGKPTSQEAEFTNSKGIVIKFRSALLPLGRDDDKEVAYIMGGFAWKEF